MKSILYLSSGYLIGMTAWLAATALSFYVLVRWLRHWKHQPRRLRWVHAGLALWMALLPLTLLELYFAFVYDTTDSFNMTNVSQKWFRMHVAPEQKPLVFGNGEGILYRDDREFPLTPAADQHHICFVGDSFTFGQGIPDVADRFSNRIRTRLEGEQPGRFIVSNLSDAGTELHWIERVLENLFQDGWRIDTVVYVMCLNDIETFHERHRTYYQDFGARTNAPSFFLFRDTYFFNLMYFRLRRFAVPEVRGYYSFLEEYYQGEPWQRMQAKLDDVRELCRRNGADFRLVVFPFLHNLGPGYPFAEAHEAIAAYCRSADIPVLDLEPHLAPHVSEGLTVNRFDAHPNERANELAAEAIRRKLLADLVDTAENDVR